MINKIKSGIYIHSPFCTTKCHYCDFYSITDRLNDMDRLVDCIIKEIKNSKQLIDKKYLFDTIFFGGGTPSLMEASQIERILNTLNDKYNLAGNLEVTLECNPDSLELNKLIDFKSIGINRISIGFQSLDNNILKVLSRDHSSKQCISSYEDARKAKIENINIDLIYCIPEQTQKIWFNTLSNVIDLDPEHISCYSLTVEKNTKLHSMVRNKEISMPSQDIDYEMFNLTRGTLTNNNFNQYEISNFSKTKMECLHNLHYWTLDPYLAFGPSAYGFDGKKRWRNSRSLDQYMTMVENNMEPIVDIENLTSNDSFNDLLMNGLRLNKGVHLKQLENFYEGDFSLFKQKAKEKWQNLEIKNNRMKLDLRGQLICDLITSDLFQ